MRPIEELIAAHRPEELSLGEKAHLWSRIEDGIAAPRAEYRTSRSRKGNRLGRALVALVGVAALLGGSVATVYASNDALPGETLFPVKIASERVRLLVANEMRQDSLRIQFAENRLDEAKKIIATKPTPKTMAFAVAKQANERSAVSPIEDSAVRMVPESSDAEERAPEKIVRRQMEQARKEFLRKKNDRGVAVIDDIIGDLDELEGGIDVSLSLAANVNADETPVQPTVPDETKEDPVSEKKGATPRMFRATTENSLRSAVSAEAQTSFAENASSTDTETTEVILAPMLIPAVETERNMRATDRRYRADKFITCPKPKKEEGTVEVSISDVRRFLRQGGDLAKCADALGYKSPEGTSDRDIDDEKKGGKEAGDGEER